MGLKADAAKENRQVIETESLMGRIESTIRHLPTSINKKVIDSFNNPSQLAHYLHFFDSAPRQQQVFIRQCHGLSAVYSRLQETLGEETYVGEWFEVDQDCIDKFADVTGDQQWIHTDPTRAKTESPFKTTISQGFLTLALVPMLTDSVDPEKTPYPEARMVVNYGLNRVHFPFPVKVGKSIRARTRIISLTPMKRGLEIVREVKVEIQNSARLACIAEPVLRLYF